jgi:hypothetical protein
MIRSAAVVKHPWRRLAATLALPTFVATGSLGPTQARAQRTAQPSTVAQYRDPVYRAGLDRRSRVMTGNPFVTPPAELGDAPYCAAVAGP